MRAPMHTPPPLPPPRRAHAHARASAATAAAASSRRREWHPVPLTPLPSPPKPAAGAGDLFQITREELEGGEDVARCPSCSLFVRVLYADETELASELRRADAAAVAAPSSAAAPVLTLASYWPASVSARVAQVLAAACCSRCSCACKS